MADGFSELHITLPEGTLSALFVLEGEFGVEYLIHELEGPQGLLVSSEATTDEGRESGLGAAAGPFFSPNRSVAAVGGTTLLVPNDPLLTMTGGDYRLGLRSTTSHDHVLRLQVTAQIGDAYPERCDLKLNLFLPERLEGDAAFTQRVQGAVEEMQSIYGAAGIDVERRQTQYRSDLLPDLPGPGDQVEPYGDLLRRGAEGHNLYVVESMGDGEPSLGGYAAAIPVARRPDTIFSGVVVAADFSDPERESDLLGYTLAHESAHGLGLFHVQELVGWEDPLTDTDPSRGGNLLAALARAEDRSISPAQALVMRSHPLCESSGLSD